MWKSMIYKWRDRWIHLAAKLPALLFFSNSKQTKGQNTIGFSQILFDSLIMIAASFIYSEYFVS
jgi:hypothetical protein